MPIVGFDHVQVTAPPGCEADARRFYGGLLGLTEVRKPPALRARGGVWFALASGQQLHVGVADEFAPARKAHPALGVGESESLEHRDVNLLGHTEQTDHSCATPSSGERSRQPPAPRVEGLPR